MKIRKFFRRPRHVRELLSHKTAAIGIAIILVTILMATFADYVSPYNPWKYTAKPLAPPSMSHPFGADDLGRDILSRIIWGARASLLFGFVATLFSGFLGTILGAISGFYGGFVDMLLSRAFEIVMMIPLYFLLILIISLWGPNLYFSMIIVGLTMWPWNARIMRGQVLSIKEKAYVEAARCVGAGDFRILFRHIVPNGIYPVLANTSLQVGWAILTEAALCFIGLGDPNVVTWGQLLFWGKIHFSSAPWQMLFPGIALMLVCLGFVFVGDGINYVLNPRIKAREV
jgi:peptide/nickel transport system permease protein